MTETTELLKNEFWIVTDNDDLVGTVSVEEDRLFYTGKGGRGFFDNAMQLQNAMGVDIENSKKAVDQELLEVEGFPTVAVPGSVYYDVHKKIYFYTKSSSSSCLYAAGYFLTKKENRDVVLFCPKLTTLEKYEYIGPFKTPDEASEASF